MNRLDNVLMFLQFALVLSILLNAALVAVVLFLAWAIPGVDKGWLPKRLRQPPARWGRR